MQMKMQSPARRPRRDTLSAQYSISRNQGCEDGLNTQIEVKRVVCIRRSMGKIEVDLDEKLEKLPLGPPRRSETSQDFRVLGGDKYFHCHGISGPLPPLAHRNATRDGVATG